MHTTNYKNTFIEIAEDCPAKKGEIPPLKGEEKTVALLQFEMVAHHPYKYTSDDVIFGVHAIRKNIPQAKLAAERKLFFSKGQACMRSSPLTKRYGWGVHNNAEGKIALVAVDSQDYKKLKSDKKLEHTRGMRSKRA
jgi:hypothetical protein